MVQSRNKHLAVGGEKYLWTYTLCWLSEFCYVQHTWVNTYMFTYIFTNLIGIELWKYIICWSMEDKIYFLNNYVALNVLVL